MGRRHNTDDLYYSRIQYVTQLNMATRFEGGGSVAVKGCDAIFRKTETLASKTRQSAPLKMSNPQRLKKKKKKLECFPREEARKLLVSAAHSREEAWHELLHAHPFYDDRPPLLLDEPPPPPP